MFERNFEVIIVGADLSGIGAAYHLQTQCPGVNDPEVLTAKAWVLAARGTEVLKKRAISGSGNERSMSSRPPSLPGTSKLGG